MSGEFSESYEAARAHDADIDPEIGMPGQETAHAYEGHPRRDDYADARQELAAAPWGGRLAIAGAGGDSPAEPQQPNELRKLPDAGADVALSRRSAARDQTTLAEDADIRVVEPKPSNLDDHAGDHRRDVELRPETAAGEDAEDSTAEISHELPLNSAIIAERTTANRIDLADNVRGTDFTQSYDGYLDVVMHGDQAGTQAYVDGHPVDFTLAETAQMIESSPSWVHRPIRLLSCRTGQESYAQELSDRLEAPVYAPNGVLHVLPDGTTFIESPEGRSEGAWRRFEPRR